MRPLIRTCLAVVASVPLGVILGTPSSFAGDPAYGEYLSGQCTTCHRRDGTESNIPDIVGWPEESFVAVLQSYKTKERENATMQTIARTLGDEEMAALAAYFASLKTE